MRYQLVENEDQPLKLGGASKREDGCEAAYLGNSRARAIEAG